MGKGGVIKHMSSDFMQDLKFLWQLHKDTKAVANALGISENKVRKRLQSQYNIKVPTRREQDERRLRNWLSEITPLIIPTSIWMGRKQDLIPNQADAVNHKTDERFMVRIAKPTKKGWRFKLDGFPQVERVLLIGLTEDSKLLFAYYLPIILTKNKKSITLTDKAFERFKPYEVSVEKAKHSISKKGSKPIKEEEKA